MTHEKYLQRLRFEIRERQQLIQFMRINEVPFTRMDILIEELRDLKIKLAEVEAIIAMDNLRKMNEN